MIENDLQLDAIIAIMLILQTEISENGITAIKQINRSCFTGSIFTNEGNCVKCIKTIGNLLQLVFFIFGCFSGLCYKVDSKVITAVLKVVCDHSKKFHIQTPPRTV